MSEKFISPVYGVRAVPIEKIRANSYNPNAVAPTEMKLLYDSIKEDGYTMPTVCYYIKEEDIYEREGGKLPVSVIDKPLGERMASTIRHNRARGTHNVDLMSGIVGELHELGKTDHWIMKHLGMDADEVLRLKQISGLASLFKDKDFSKAKEL